MVASRGAQRSDPRSGSSKPTQGRLLTLDEVAEHLGVPRKSVYGYIHQHGLPAARVGRHLRVRPADLEAWLERQAVGPRTVPQQRGWAPGTAGAHRPSSTPQATRRRDG